MEVVWNVTLVTVSLLMLLPILFFCYNTTLYLFDMSETPFSSSVEKYVQSFENEYFTEIVDDVNANPDENALNVIFKHFDPTEDDKIYNWLVNFGNKVIDFFDGIKTGIDKLIPG